MDLAGVNMQKDIIAIVRAVLWFQFKVSQLVLHPA